MCLGTVLLKDELARYLDYGKKQAETAVVNCCYIDFDLASIIAAVILYVAAAAYSQLLCQLLGKYLLVSELHKPHIVTRVFFRLQFSAAESWMTV